MGIVWDDEKQSSGQVASTKPKKTGGISWDDGPKEGQSIVDALGSMIEPLGSDTTSRTQPKVVGGQLISPYEPLPGEFTVEDVFKRGVDTAKIAAKNIKEKPVASSLGLLSGAYQAIPTPFPQKEYASGVEELYKKISKKDIPPEYEMMKGVGDFGGRTATGMALEAAIPVPGSGLLTSVGKGAIGNVPFALKAMKEGGVKGFAEDAMWNTLFDVLGFKVGAPILKKILKKAPADVTDISELSRKQIKQGFKGKVRTHTGEIVDFSPVTSKPKSKVPFTKFDISDIEARRLRPKKAPNSKPLNHYAEQADAVVNYPDARGPADLFNQQAVKAFKDVKKDLSKVGKMISSAIEESADAPVNISKLKSSYADMIEKRLGGVFDESGKLIDAPGKLIVDDAAISSAEQIYQLLNRVGDTIPLETAVFLKRKLGTMVPTVPMGQFTVKHEILDGIEQSLYGMIDNGINRVAPKIKELNKKYAKESKLIDEFSRLLGRQINVEEDITKNGAHLAKLVTDSLAARGKSDVFRQVKEITGGKWDLLQEAGYAMTAMRYSGSDEMIKQAEGIFGLLGGSLYRKPTYHTTGGINLANLAKKATEFFTGSIEEGRMDRILEWYVNEQRKQGVDVLRYAPESIAELADIPIPAATKEVVGTEMLPFTQVDESLDPAAYSRLRGQTSEGLEEAGEKLAYDERMAERAAERAKQQADKVASQQEAVSSMREWQVPQMFKDVPPENASLSDLIRAFNRNVAASQTPGTGPRQIGRYR